MGLKITDTLYTDAGASNEVYININSIRVDRNYGINVRLNNYLNRAAKENSERDTIACRQLYGSMTFVFDNSSPDFTNMTSASIYEFAYTKVKERLIENGLTVEDDIAVEEDILVEDESNTTDSE
jgi:hypothetical protein